LAAVAVLKSLGLGGGALTLRMFFLGFRTWGIHWYFGFVEHIVSQRLASRGIPALSWLFAVAEGTLGYVS